MDNKKKLSKYEIFRRIMFYICLLACVLLVVQLGYIMVGYVQARRMSSDVLGGVVDMSKPPAESGDKAPVIVDPSAGLPDYVTSEYFAEWLEHIRATKEKYPDFIGYISIENLDILYPIVQTDNNSYYLDHLIDGTQNKNGEIFLDSRNNSYPLTDNQNIVLYGHNLADGTKFHNLTKLRKEENYYNSPISIITEEGIFTFTIFSFYKTDEKTNYTKTEFAAEKNRAIFCTNEQKKSMYESNFEFTGKEVILTLSTCVNDFGGRWCTHAVLTSITK